MEFKELISPLQVLDELWQNSILSSTSRASTSDFNERAHFSRLFDDFSNYSQLPSLNKSTDNLSNEGICSYRGIVQHNLGKRIHRTSKYKEELRNVHPDFTVETHNGVLNDPRETFERLALVCGPIPGESLWSRSFSHSTLEQEKTKRCIDFTYNGVKRVAVDCGQDRPCSLEADAVGDIHTGAADAQCMVKLYECDDVFRINDIFEFVGVYYSPRQLERLDIDMQEDDDFGVDTSPFANLPTVHCLAVRRLGSSFPLIPPLSFMTPLSTRDSTPQLHHLESTRISHIRQSLLERLTECYRGDEVAAEYSLLAILSKVYGARVGSSPLGALTLTISGLPSSTAGDSVVSDLFHFFGSIVPKMIVLNAATDYKDIISEYNDESGVFSVSRLQLSPGTLLIIDERSLIVNDQLNITVKKNLPYIASAVERLSLSIRSDYCSVELPLDISIIVLSGTHSSFNSLVRCIWTPQQTHTNDTATTFALQDARLWWANARLFNVGMAVATVSLAENDFVNARQIDTRLTAEDFSVWLSVARMIAISKGDVEISPQHWALMRALEKHRIDRFGPRRSGDSVAHYMSTILHSSSPNTVIY